jgi:hypothetical protein
LRIFRRLTQISEFRRRNLPFVETLVDLDLLREIGLHQARKKPLTLKLLFLKGIASVATVQRRLARLKLLGVVHQAKAAHDRRLITLSLSPAVWRSFVHLSRLMAKPR